MADPGFRTLARNVLYVNGGQLWRVVSRLVLTPLVLARIGLEGYGTWALLFGLSAYVTMFNGSFATAYAKLTAELERLGEHRRLAEALGAGMLAVGAAGAAGMAGIWLLAPQVLPWLGIPEALLAEAHAALLLVAIGVALEMSAGCALHVLDGLQRMDLRTRLNVAGSIVDFGVVLALLGAGLGLAALAWGFLAGRSVAIAGAWVLVRRACPALPLSPLRASRAGLRAALALGARFQALGLVNTAVGQATRLAIAALCGAAALGAFRLGSRVLSLAMTPARSIVAPLLPAFASLQAGGDTERWKTLFARASKALAAAGVFGAAFAALYAEPLLFAWTGERFAQAVLVTQVMAVASLATLLTGVGTAALRAAGTVRLELGYGLVGGAASLAAVAIGYPLAGFAGIAIGIAAARTGAALWFHGRLAATPHLPTRVHAGASLLAPIAWLAPILLAVSLAAGRLPVLALDSADRWQVLASVLALAAACALACAPVLWLAVLSAGERTLLRKQLAPGAQRAGT